VESETIKMEVGDNFVVISTKLENGNPFYVVLCDKYCCLDYYTT
jgi:hypothetical protein